MILLHKFIIGGIVLVCGGVGYQYSTMHKPVPQPVHYTITPAIVTGHQYPVNHTPVQQAPVYHAPVQQQPVHKAPVYHAPVSQPVKVIQPVAPAQKPMPGHTPAPTPKPVAKPAPQPVAAPAPASDFAHQVLTLVNKDRAQGGLPALTMDSKLTTVAMTKAQDMKNNNYFDHNSPTYGSPFDMMKKFGVSYGYAGENIAMGQRTPSEVETAWMNSPGHKANIMNVNYKKIGIAYYNGEWVQEFTD